MAEFNDIENNQVNEVETEKDFSPVYSYTQKVNSLISAGKITAPKYRTLSQEQMASYLKAKDMPEYDRKVAMSALKKADENTFYENASNAAVIEAMDILSGDKTRLAIGNMLVSGDYTPLIETGATLVGYKAGEEAAKAAGRGWLGRLGAGIVGGAAAGAIVGALTPTELGKDDVVGYMTEEQKAEREKQYEEFYEQQAVAQLKKAGYTDEQIEKLRKEPAVQSFGRAIMQSAMEDIEYKAAIAPKVDEGSIAAIIVGGAASFGELALVGAGTKMAASKIAKSVKMPTDRFGRKAAEFTRKKGTSYDEVVDRYAGMVGTKAGTAATTTEMSTEIMGQGALESVRKYIEETGDTKLEHYQGDLKNVALDAYNTHIQNIIEYKLGVGKFIRNPRLATKYGEWLNGFAQEFSQGEINDIAEWLKGNQSAMDILRNIPQNMVEGVVGAVLQGGVGTGIYTYYHNQNVNDLTGVVMSQSTAENPIDEKKAREFAERKVIELEEGIANDVAQDVIQFTGATQYQGQIYNTIRDNVKKAIDYQREQMKETLEGSKYDDMTEDELAQHIEAVAQDETDRTVIESLENGTPLSESPRLKGETIDGTYYLEGSDYARVTAEENERNRQMIREAIYAEQRQAKRESELAERQEKREIALAEKIADEAEKAMLMRKKIETDQQTREAEERERLAERTAKEVTKSIEKTIKEEKAKREQMAHADKLQADLLKVRKQREYGKNPQTIKQLFGRSINLQFARDSGILQAFGFDESSPVSRIHFKTKGGISDWNDIVQVLSQEGIMQEYSDTYEGQGALEDYAKKLLLETPTANLYELRTGVKSDEKFIKKDQELLEKAQEAQMDGLLKANGYTDEQLKDMSWQDKSDILAEIYRQEPAQPEYTEEELAELDALEFQVDETRKVSPLRYKDYDYIGKRIFTKDKDGKTHYIEPMVVLYDDTIVPLISLRDSFFPDKQVFALFKSEGGESMESFRKIWSSLIKNIESIIRGTKFGSINNGTYEKLVEADNKKLLLDALEETKTELTEDNDSELKAQIAVVDNFIENVKGNYIEPRFDEIVSLSDGTHLVTHGVGGSPEEVGKFLKQGKVYNPSLYIAEKPSEYGYHSVVLFATPNMLQRPEARIFDRDAYTTTIGREPTIEKVEMPSDDILEVAVDNFDKYFDLERDLFYKHSGSEWGDFALSMESGLENIKDPYYFNGYGISHEFVKKYIIVDAIERGLLNVDKKTLYKSQNGGKVLETNKIAELFGVEKNIGRSDTITEAANKALELIGNQENKTRDEVLDSYKNLAVSRKEVIKSTGEEATPENIAKAQRQYEKQYGRWRDIFNYHTYNKTADNLGLLEASGETGILASVFARELPYKQMVAEKQKTGRHYDSVESRKKMRKYAIMSAMGNLISHGKIAETFLPVSSVGKRIKKTDVAAYMRNMLYNPDNMISTAYADETVAEIEKMAKRFAKIYEGLTKEEQDKITSGKVEEGSELETKIKQGLEKNGVKDELVIDYAFTLMKEVYNHPVSYFEGKILADVGVNEFVGAYVNESSNWDKVARMLESQGIKVVRGNPADVRSATAKLEEELDLDLRFQDRQRGKGGAYDARNRSITLGSAANITTLPHELAHYWIDKNFKWARSGKASTAWMQQWQAVEKWLGIDPEDKYLTSEASEKFARAYERFLGEEELPLVLKKSMADFRDFVLDHYDYELDDAKGLQDRLGRPIKLNDAVKEWFRKSIYDSYMSASDMEVVNERLAQADREIKELQPAIDQSKELKDAAQNSAEINEVAPTGMDIQTSAGISNDVIVGKRTIGGGEEKESKGVIRQELGGTYESTSWDIQEQMVSDYLESVSIDEAIEALDNDTYPDKIDPNFLRQALVEKLLDEGREIEATALIEETADDFTEAAQKLQAARRINTPFTNAIRMLTIGKATKLAEARYGKNKDAVKSLDAAMNALVAKYEKDFMNAQTDEERELVYATMQDEAIRTIGTLEKDKTGGLDFQDIEDKEERKEANALRKRQNRRASIKAYRSRAKRSLKQALGLEPSREQVRQIKKLSVKVAREIKDFRNAVKENKTSAIDPTKILEAQNELNEYMNQQLPPRVLSTAADAVNSYMMANMLWNPATNVFNLESTWVQMIPHIMATYINYGKGTISWTEKAKLIKQALALQAKTGYNIFSLQDFFDKKTIWAEKFYEPTSMAGKAIRFPLTMLGLADTMNKGIVFLNHVDSMATSQAKEEGKKNGWNKEQITQRAKELFYQALNTDPRTITRDGLKIRQSAVREGEEATFTQNSQTAQFVNKFRKMLNLGAKTGLGNVIMPFTTTIANIAEDTVLNYALGSVRNIPLNLYPAIATQFDKTATAEMKKEAWKKLTPETKNVIKNMIGILMILSLALSDPDDDSYVLGYDRQTEVDKDIRQNRNAPSGYAVRIGDKWVDLDLFGIGSPWARAYLIAKRNDFSTNGWVKGVASVIDLVPGVSEIEDIYKSLETTTKYKGESEALMEFAGGKVEDIAERLIPAQALFNQIGNITDTTKRMGFGGVKERVLSKIPVARETLEERTSKQTGEPLKQTDTLANLITGQRIKDYVESTPADRARYELAQEGKPLNYQEGRSKLSALGKESKEYKKAVQRVRRDFTKKLNSAVQTTEYQRLDIDQKKKLADKLHKEALDKVKASYGLQDKKSVEKKKKTK